jgi:predicted component of type VI protein secretion system
MKPKSEIRKFWASMLMLGITVSLVGYLTFIPVPVDNKEVVLTVLGVLLGGASAAMPNLFGDQDGETDALRARVRQLEEQIAVMQAEYKTTKAQYDTIVKMLVDRHLEPGKGAALLEP